MLRTILFDFYGTLAVYGDMESANQRTWDQIFAYLRQRLPALEHSDFVRRWDEQFRRTIPLAEKRLETVFMTKIANLAAGYGLDLGDREARGIAEGCLETWHRAISFPDDLGRVLTALAERFALGIVSNFDHPSYLRDLLRRLDIERHFAVVAISGEVGFSKPDPRIFEFALERTSSPPRCTAFVGDDLDDDIAGASRLGCLPILIDRRGRELGYSGVRIAELTDLLTLAEVIAPATWHGG